MAAGRRLLLVLVAAGLAVQPVRAADSPAQPQKKLQQLERAIEQQRKKKEQLREKTSSLEHEMAELQQDMVAAAQKIQRHEAEVARLQDRLAELTEIEGRKQAKLERNHDSFANVLMALARLARHPPEAIIAQPMGVTETVRSALLLRATVPRIEDRAARLRADLADLAAARREAARRQTELTRTAMKLDRERERLDSLLDRKHDLHDRAASEMEQAAARAAALAEEAESLRDLMARLERQRREREAREKREQEEARRRAEEARAAARARRQAEALPKPIGRAKGRLVFPVVGSVDGQYGQATDAGLTRKGITIRARGDAQVVAPYGGRVVYADTFRGYGLLLIIEHGDGYHSLLAGLGHIDTAIGRTVVAGEPVGVMGHPQEGEPSLYVELRRNGQPVNPLPWLAARKDKVNG